MLSILELQSPYYAQEKADWLYFLIQNISSTELIFEAYGQDFRFPSILEITTSEFGKRKPEEYQYVINGLLNETQKQFRKIKAGKKIEDSEDEFIERVKRDIPTVNESFRRYHKYIAIVKADGDNMGAAVTAMFESKPEKVEEIDKAILAFNLEAVNKIDDFGGKSIYLGGDDLLFFAPVCSDGKTVFDLVHSLSVDYNKRFAVVFEGFDLETKPTLSFGISITYYKYPMNEALKIADDLLSEAKDKSLGKNAVAFRLMKHSGQFFGTRLAQDKVYYYRGSDTPENTSDKTPDFLRLVQNTRLEKEDAFLSSVMYRMREMDYLIKAILKDTANKQRLESFFENNFNEGVHQTKRVFLNSVADYLWQVYKDSNKDAELALKTVFGTLRLIQFIHQKDSENDNN
jgi:CRISPR-associated protein Cmr2